MAESTLVENQIEDGQKLIEAVAAKGVDVTASFWACSSEDGQWTLYIASKTYDDKGPAHAYRVVVDAFRQLEKPWITVSEVKVIGANNAIASDVLKVHKRFPGRAPTRSRSLPLGGMANDEVYIYPQIPNQVPVA
jgi:hypothetical protein